jgi:hypothetical protein
VYQEWPDKQSDKALTRFCRCGLAAGRVESILEDEDKHAEDPNVHMHAADMRTHVEGPPKVKYFVVRTSAFAKLEVIEGYARYGSDCYFDADWNVVKIVDAGYGKPAADNQDFDYNSVTVFKPGDDGWAQAKFRFRSSVLTMVTIVDHL